MTFASKVCTVEKSCQVRRVKAVQDLSLKLGDGSEDYVTANLSPSSGKKAWIAVVSREVPVEEIIIMYL